MGPHCLRRARLSAISSPPAPSLGPVFADRGATRLDIADWSLVFSASRDSPRMRDGVLQLRHRVLQLQHRIATFSWGFTVAPHFNRMTCANGFQPSTPI